MPEQSTRHWQTPNEPEEKKEEEKKEEDSE